MPLQSISRQSIGDNVYNQFMEAIVSGEWKPGERIPSENELANKLNVSRVSVRGALQRLAGLGLIESRQGEGTFVCELTGAQYANNLVPVALLGQTSVQNLLEFRMIIECEIAALAAVRATAEDIENLCKNYQAHMVETGGPQRLATFDLDFHSILACASKNPLIIQIYVIFKQIFQKSMYEVINITGGSGADVYHARIIDAVKRRDAVCAREEMREHIQKTIDAVLNSQPGQSG